jgi:hypothetical protein
MIKRLNLRSANGNPIVDWPVHDARMDKHLMASRKPFRRIVIMIDNELLSDVHFAAAPTKAGLLSSLLRHDLVKLFRYADEGPPGNVPPRPGEPLRYDGWVTVTGQNAETSVWGTIYCSSETSYTLGGIMGNAVEIATDDTRTSAYSDLSPSDASARRRRDGIAAQVASQGLSADLYITERPYLHAVKREVSRGVTVCGIEEALPLLGLYFRGQGEFPIFDKFTYNRGLFFFVGTRELLPECWRWLRACHQHSAGGGAEDLPALAASLLMRVDRALAARDAIHIALNQPQDQGTHWEARSQLDVTLVELMAAVDITARVAHRVLGLPAVSEYSAGWQKQGRRQWLTQVRQLDSTLASVVDPGSVGLRVLTILRLLRNSVHGTVLDGLAVRDGAGPMESLVGVPVTVEDEVLAAMDALEGRATWGVATRMPERFHLDPGVFVDRLFEHTLTLLNTLMEKTPVERLLHVALSSSDSVPPEDSPTNPNGSVFRPWAMASIRWQLGF